MILGIDLGSKTMGLAISESHIIANNLETFRFENEDYSLCITHLVELNAKYNFQEIVLGYPKHMNGDVGVRAKISEDFKALIEKTLPGVKVILEDERLSTNAVFGVFRQSKTNIKQRKQFKDELSAVVILQKYLDRRSSF